MKLYFDFVQRESTFEHLEDVDIKAKRKKYPIGDSPTEIEVPDEFGERFIAAKRKYQAVKKIVLEMLQTRRKEWNRREKLAIAGQKYKSKEFKISMLKDQVERGMAKLEEAQEELAGMENPSEEEIYGNYNETNVNVKEGGWKREMDIEFGLKNRYEKDD